MNAALECTWSTQATVWIESSKLLPQKLTISVRLISFLLNELDMFNIFKNEWVKIVKLTMQALQDIR